MSQKPAYLNFTVDHMTLLLHPKLYTVAYVVFRNIFGTTPDDLLYEKRRKQKDGSEVSMTFATKVGEWSPKNADPLNTIFAVVQPSEPLDEPSHVRQMLDGHQQVAHWQHIALRTPDLISFYDHALKRGVQFVTPILKDENENLIQVFSGEWFFPGSKASGLFFEFLQRDPSEGELAKIQKANKQTWFRDETFLGLYDEKEREYQSGNVRPFLPDAIFNAVTEKVKGKQVWEITDADLHEIDQTMIKMAAEIAKT